jgi:competence protein ComEC
VTASKAEGSNSGVGSEPDAATPLTEALLSTAVATPHDTRLVLPAVTAWGGAALAVGVPDLMPVVLIALAVGLVGITFEIARRTLSPATRAGHAGRGQSRGRGRSRTTRRLAVAGVSVAVALAIAAGVSIATPLRAPAALETLGERQVTVELTVTGQTRTAESRSFGGSGGPVAADIRFRAVATAFIVASPDGARTHAAESPVLVFLPGADRTGAAPEIGARLLARGSLLPTDEGSDTAWLFFVRGAATEVAPAPWYLDWANELRLQFRETAATLPGDGAQLVPGLALGDESLVGAGLDDEMKRSGLSHLTAVSGANCALVIAGIMLLGGILKLRRGSRIAASLVALVLFVVLVTPQPSVLRAAVMAAIVLFSLGASRAARGLPTMCLAVMVLIVMDPWLARSFGFALSVLATAGLLLLASPLAARLARFMPAWLAMVISIPLAAQIACQPVLVLLNPAIAPYSVIANMLAAPAAPVATILGLLACLLGALIPPLASVGAWLTWLPASWIAAVATFFAHAPGASLPWLPGLVGCLLLAIAVAVLGWILLGTRFPDARRLTGILLATALIAGYGGILAGGILGQRLALPTNWQIAACDVGQGDAVVVRSAGQIAVIDVGPDAELLTRCLGQLGVSRIEILVITHYDLDHVGGIDAVLGLVDLALVGPTQDAGEDALLAELEAGGAAVEFASRGDAGVLGELNWQVLWPQPDSDDRGNDASVTLLVQGSINALFLGDLGERSQEEMMAASRLGRLDVVKVSHHGSADASAALYDLVAADAGLVSVGVDNGYGHPSDKALAMLEHAGTAALRTDASGLLVLAPDADGLRVWTERAAPESGRPSG